MLVIHENNKTKTISMNFDSSIYTFFKSDTYKNNVQNKYDSIIAISNFNVYFNKKDLILDQAVISRKIIENDLLEIYTQERFTSIYKNGMVFIKSGIELYLFTGSIVIIDGIGMRLKEFITSSRQLYTRNILYVTKGFDIVAEKCKLVDVDASSGYIVTYTYVYKNETYKVVCNSVMDRCPVTLNRGESLLYLPILNLKLYESIINCDNSIFRSALYNFSLEVYDAKPIVNNELNMIKFNYGKIHIEEYYMLDYTKKKEELSFYDCLKPKQIGVLKEQYNKHEDKFLLLDKQKELQELNKEIIKLRGVEYEQ